MQYIIIDVPDMNDSVSRVTLLGKPYQIRFTWNDTVGCWTFGLLDASGDPIVIGIKIVPQFPLNLFYGTGKMPAGIFAALTEQERVGRRDFADDKARFAFIPAEEA